MIAELVFCPHPPLLVPGAGGQTDHPGIVAVRDASLAAVRRALACRPERVVVLGSDDRPPAGPVRPPATSHVVADWLLDTCPWAGERHRLVADHVRTDDLTEVVAGNRRTVVLVMADGTATRDVAAPGYLDPRAASFDGAVVAALAGGRAGDVDALADIDRTVAAELWVRAAPAIAAAGRLGQALLADGARLQADLSYDDAPLGVGYWVARWLVT